IFGVGGIQSMPGLLAAKSLGIPIALLEQNRIMGKANRALIRIARKVYAHLPVSGAKANHPKVSIAGNPVRRSLGKYSTPEARLDLGLDAKKTTLLVMGGSQGAQAINDFIVASFPLFHAAKESLQIIHLTGTKNFEEMNAAYKGASFDHYLLPYGKEMGKLFAAADIVLCRSGATTISELTMLGKPMILVPLPSSKEGDQEFNARFVEERGAAMVIEQSRFAEPALMTSLLEKLILNTNARAMMQDSAALLGRPRAGKDIALEVLAEIGVQVDPQRADSERALRQTLRAKRAA
ncbi:MAG: glycosyltransferase, partial [Planctomycetes bacterium]|nr:glycosyltransferase [Planctomycetota bacterium]